MPRVWKPSPPQPVPEATHNARLCPARSGSSVRRNFNSDEKNNNRNKSKCKSSKSKSRTKRKGLVPFELSDNGFSHGLKKSSPADTRILQVVRVNDDDDNIKDNHTLSRLASSFASRAKKSKTIHSDRSPSPPLTKRLKTSKSSSSFSPHINQQYPPRRVVLVTLSRSAVKGKDNNFDSPSPQARRGGRRSKLSPPKSRAVTSRTHFSGFDIKFAATRMRAKPIDLARRKNLRCRDTRGQWIQ